MFHRNGIGNQNYFQISELIVLKLYIRQKSTISRLVNDQVDIVLIIIYR